MTRKSTPARTVHALDAESRALVSLAVVIAVGDEETMKKGVLRAHESGVNPDWVEEVILQSYLFVGFPRALNGMRAWRKSSGRPAPETDSDAADFGPDDWRARGEATCATVYGASYERLRVNIRGLHPALDTWMVEEGYGRVLGRTALSLRQRELCVLAVCAATEQDRQLHSHLHGALHAGAAPAEIDGALAIATTHLSIESTERISHLWSRVRAVQ